MGIKELAAKVVEAHPFVTEAKAVAILRTALNALKAELAAPETETVKLAPLGNFRITVKPAKGEPEGEAGKPAQRRVHLRLLGANAAKAGGAKAGGGKGAGKAGKAAGKGAGKGAGKAKKAAKAATESGGTE